MKRKLILCLLATVLVLSLPATRTMASSPVPVQVDGTTLSGTSYLLGSVTYVPLRALLNAFGGWDVAWEGNSRSAVANSSTDSLSAGIGKSYLTVNGVRYRTPAAIFLQNGATYVPLRITAEALGASVAWDYRMRGAAVTSANFDLPCTASDLYWLARIISAESRGETLEGQIAVGNVVLNRVASKEFPNTIPGVIFDRKHGVQFEPVSNGTVYSTPTQQSVQAARLALSGSSTAGKALYFYAPALSAGTWINANRTYLATIGCHRFYL